MGPGVRGVYVWRITFLAVLSNFRLGSLDELCEITKMHY